MVRVKDVVNWAKSLADNKKGHDQDGVWGFQCVDLPNGASSIFFGKTLRGNAIDLLNSAKGQGYKVEYNIPGNINSRPKAGAFFVQQVTGHNFGHVGLVTEDSDGYTMKTIEQNIDGWSDKNRDGINDQLQFGGVAKYNTRNFDGVVGWFYLPYDNVEFKHLPKLMKLDKLRKATVTVDVLNVRREPSLNAEVVATYKQGESFLYQNFIYNDNRTWLSYIGKTGGRVFVASDNLQTKETYVDWEYYKGA